MLNNLTVSQKRIAVFYTGGILALTIFLLCVYFFWPAFDPQISNLIRQDRGRFFSAVMGFVSWWGMSYMMIVPVFVVSALFFILSYKREAGFVLSVFIADTLNIFLKLLINRPRPEEMDIFPKFQQASFPSGHVVHYVVFFGFIFTVMCVHSRIPLLIRWSISVLCVFLILGVSVARIYLGTHWATDILVAYILGFILLGVIILQYLKGLNHYGP